MELSEAIERVRKNLTKAGLHGFTVEAYNGGIRLTGEASSYDDILAAGRLAVNKEASRGVINDIRLKGYTEKPMRIPALRDTAYDGRTPDVLIVGGGIVGAAIARELSRYKLEIMLAEKEYDVGTAQSSRNDGMIHAGIDLKPNSKKVKYNMRGNKLYDRLSVELNVPIKKIGQYVFFTSRIQKLAYPIIYFRGRKNDIPVCYYDRKTVLQKVPNPGTQYGATFCPGAGVVSPYLMTVALAENAAMNGAEFCFDTAVTGIENDGKRVTAVHTNRGVIYPRVLVNAAGIFSDKIAGMAGDRFFTIHPRRGVEAILDKKRGFITDSVLGKFAIKSSSGKSHTKGGGVVHTIDDNILIGPTADETPDRENEATTAAELNEVLQKQKLLAPDLSFSDVITYFAGTRAATYEEEYIVETSPVIGNFVQAAGIQSPGVTAAPAIAEDIAEFAVSILKREKTVARKEDFNPIRKGISPVNAMTEEERNARIKENPDYGVIICRCEEISKGEIVDAIRSHIPCHTIDGIKRRVRAGMGRCQGGFCAPLITSIIAEETGKPLTAVTKKGAEAPVLFGCTKEAEDA